MSYAGAAQIVSATAEISIVAGEGAGAERWRGQIFSCSKDLSSESLTLAKLNSNSDW